MPSVLRQDFKSTIIKAGSYHNPNAITVVNAHGHAVHAADNNSPKLQDGGAQPWYRVELAG